MKENNQKEVTVEAGKNRDRKKVSGGERRNVRLRKKIQVSKNKRKRKNRKKGHVFVMINMPRRFNQVNENSV